ncbi:MAG: hypothetical protein R3F55_03920 [Alphaproteobacteria bacterium]
MQATRAIPFILAVLCAGAGPAATQSAAQGAAQGANDVVGAWTAQSVDQMTGVPFAVQYGFFDDGTYQKSLQIGAGYDYIAGPWFTQGNLLRLEVRQHWSTAGEGPTPPGELWYFERRGGQLVLVNAACPSPQMAALCTLVLNRAQ